MKKHFYLAAMLLLATVSLTSCLNDDDEIDYVSWPATDKDVTTVEVMQNPTKMCIAGNYLVINGYGSNDWYTEGALTYPVQLVNPRNLEVTTLKDERATNIAPYGSVLLMSYSETKDWMNYTTTFKSYNTATNQYGSDFLTNAPQELYSQNVYMLAVNPYNGHIYVAVTDYSSSSTIYHFNSNGLYNQTIECRGASVSRVVFSGDDLYLLSEGVYGQNNSEIYKVESGSDKAVALYSTMNGGQKLGDTANDLIGFKNTLYVVVNGSGYVARLEANGHETARYAFTEEDGAPRFAAGYGNYVYVSTYGGKVIKLTAELQKVGEIALNTALESILVCADRLCVLGTGMGADNRLFVIDPSKF